MSKMDRKPPLPRSPVRLRSRRVLQSSSRVHQSVQTPPGSLTKAQKLTRSWDVRETELCPDYRSISCDLQSLTKMIGNEIEDTELSLTEITRFGSASVFERGRFYDEYSARRNERLKRKKGEELREPKKAAFYDLGVTVESSKKRDSKKLEGLKKSVAVAYTAGMSSQTPRYSLRSSTKENKKPPQPVTSSSMKSAIRSVRRSGTWTAGRI